MTFLTPGRFNHKPSFRNVVCGDDSTHGWKLDSGVPWEQYEKHYQYHQWPRCKNYNCYEMSDVQCNNRLYQEYRSMTPLQQRIWQHWGRSCAQWVPAWLSRS